MRDTRRHTRLAGAQERDHVAITPTLGQPLTSAERPTTTDVEMVPHSNHSPTGSVESPNGVRRRRAAMREQRPNSTRPVSQAMIEFARREEILDVLWEIDPLKGLKM